ncbi:hypothetical protein BDV96DRAFT_588871 [Lophiotrema nucula]|uniref:Uncharacterized protein n=1 Tax=Lophiotrema nucula TaxID=690887 RepID=A0A6A5YMY1_9PLEO|nr:hypothetical protein BDV96DRAFT_588871 [Lophiotrema nucula]
MPARTRTVCKGPPITSTTVDACKKTTVTDAFISCTQFGSTTSSCSVTQTATRSGCSIEATTSTTVQGPACTRASLSLDDDEGDNEGEPMGPSGTSTGATTGVASTVAPSNSQFSISSFQPTASLTSNLPNTSSGSTSAVSTAASSSSKFSVSSFKPTDLPSIELPKTSSGFTSAVGPSPAPPAIPAPSLPPLPPTSHWEIHFTQHINGDDSSLIWTIYDSNNNEAGKGDNGPISPTRDLHLFPHKLDITVHDEQDKDKAIVALFYRTEIIIDDAQLWGDFRPWKPCYPTFDTGNKKQKPATFCVNRGYHRFGLDPFGCDISQNDLKWGPALQGGVAREFKCWLTAFNNGPPRDVYASL